IFKKAGLMEERLFIDYVDYEFSWRLKKLGYTNGITRNCLLQHSIGKKMINIYGYKINISSPFRYFYQYRNYFVLLRRGYVPIKWKLFTGIKFIARFIYFPFFIKDGWTIQRFMLKGIISSFKYKV